MKRLRLKQKVEVTGRDYFGRPASISFTPSETPGWFLEGGIPITPDIVNHSTRRMVLQSGCVTLNIFEHIGVLRYLGLDEVTISSTPWPPYITAGELWRKLQEHVEAVGEMEWVCMNYPKMCIGVCDKEGNRSTKMSQGTVGKMQITIRIDYKNLPHSEPLRCSLPSDEGEATLLHSLDVGSQGWPPKLYHLSRVISVFGWPHHKLITWPQEHSPQETVSRFMQHRLVDLLGCLAVACPPGRLLSGNVVSEQSGHKGDIDLIGQIQTT